MAESIDTPLVRVPFESLKRLARDRKHVVDQVNSTLAELEHSSVRLGDSASQEQAERVLDAAAGQLKTLKRKLGEIGASERAECQRTHARLKHLHALGPPQHDAMLAWQRRRLDLILVDHFLRSGLHETAAELAQDSGVQDLVDSHILAAAQEVVAALGRQDCGPALQWCSQHDARLKKLKSRLEFKLRIQEFVELVQAGEMLEAIAYARRHFGAFAGTHMAELQHAAGLLAFRAETSCKRYEQLLAPERWDALIELYHQELYRLHNLTPQSLLVIHLQAGLSALKMPSNGADAGTGNKQDPMHLEAFKSLSIDLPYAKHVHSKLVCAITHELMTDRSHPVMLPSGNVYSQKGVEQMAAANGGRFVDPATGTSHDLSETTRIYIS